MSAHEQYQLLVGEVGINRREYLYELEYWEVVLITRGYGRRCRNLWSAARWHAYQVMSAMPYTDLKKAGICRPTDLITFPWEKGEKAGLPGEDEMEEYRRDMEAFKHLKEKKKGGQE